MIQTNLHNKIKVNDFFLSIILGLSVFFQACLDNDGTGPSPDEHSQAQETEVQDPEVQDPEIQEEEPSIPERSGLPSSMESLFLVDDRLGLIVYNGEDFTFDSTIAVGSELVEIDSNDSHLILGKKYEVAYEGHSLQLFRTELPIVVVDTTGESIQDEPKIVADFSILEPEEAIFQSLIGIEIRGGSSKRFPKKSFSVELWEDVEGEDTFKEKLLDLRNDDDWILDGLWNEPLRIRDYVSHEIWQKFGRYPYQEDEPDITLGIEKKFVELFLNEEYRGVYYLGEKIDRKQLALKKYDEGLRGELYKGNRLRGGTLYINLDDYSNNSEEWSGYEAKYPDEEGEIDWSNLHALVDFVVNSDKATFDASIAAKIDLENMADYYILLNMLYATDNIARNVYTARYDQDSPYFFVPWDMDGTFGNNWRGDRTNITDRMLSNGLYDRLLENDDFKLEVKSRWNNLKTNVLSVAEMQTMFSETFQYLKDNGIFEREALSNELPHTYNETEITFIHGWIAERHAYLDAYFDDL